MARSRGLGDVYKRQGLGFIGMYKNENGQLQFKMKSDNEEGYELVYFQKIKNLYVPFE
jgi:hypothetical protein